MHIAELKQHPRNTETFRDLTGEEFEDLKASISEHGIIEPIIVNQHGVNDENSERRSSDNG